MDLDGRTGMDGMEWNGNGKLKLKEKCWNMKLIRVTKEGKRIKKRIKEIQK